jgi:peptide/nickel transport system permease protein
LINWVFTLLRRFIVATLVLWVVSGIVFALLYITPGDAALILLGDAPPTPATIAEIRKEYHLDQPLLVQYRIWLAGAMHLEFGTSVRTKEPVLRAIGSRVRVTFFLLIYSAVIAIGLGVALGTLSALHVASALDRVIVALSVIGNSTAAFVSGLVLLYVFGIVVPIFPVFGPGHGFLDEVWHLTLPAVTLALTALALVIKLTRAAMITSLEQDFVAFACARGLSWIHVVWAYAVRNSLNAIVTAAGLAILRLLGWAVIVEVTFALPGIGALLVDAVNFKDIPVVQALGLLTSVVVIGVNFSLDILYEVIDPRVRLTRVGA